jgi:cytochrome c peroxidase
MDMKRIFFFSLLAAISLSSCDPFESISSPEMKLELPDSPFNYNVAGTNDHLPTLGRVLFYDPRLSINNSVSCSSCHKQTLAFSDNLAFSRGVENRLTARNSMPIQNIISSVFKSEIESSDSSINFTARDVGAYLPGVVPPPMFFFKSTQLFWDGRESELETMVTRPITNHIEMGIHNLDDLANKLSTFPEYNTLFTNAFGDKQITKENLARGLSSFLLSIRSTHSKFDKSIFAVNGDQAEILSSHEEEGRLLFFDKFKCNQCHESNGFADIGLEAQAVDIGLAEVTGRSSDVGSFKIPSLRNVQLTGPYMHDGRFKTLDEVLNHYSVGINKSQNLDPRLKAVDGKPLRLNMTDLEKRAIIAFLQTLTDYEMISDPKLSNPFVTR